MYTVIKAFKITIRLNLETVYCDQRAGLLYLMGGPQVSLMVWVVTPSPRRLRGTSSGFTLTATLWLSRPRELSLVLAATATEYWNVHGNILFSLSLSLSEVKSECCSVDSPGKYWIFSDDERQRLSHTDNRHTTTTLITIPATWNSARL